MLTDWIAELRALHATGEAPARGLLQSAWMEFCAVGVLCDVVDVGGWDKTTGKHYTWHGATNGWPQGMPLPADVKPEHLRVANTLNADGATFAQIADALEAV